MKAKLVLAVGMVASASNIYADQLVKTQLSCGTVTVAKLISAKVVQVYIDGGNPTELTPGKIVHADAISQDCKKAKSNALSGHISELKILSGEQLKLDAAKGLSVIVAPKVDVKLSAAAFSCIRIAKEDIKLDGDNNGTFTSDVEIGITDGVLEKVTINNAEVPTSAISSEKPQSTITTTPNIPSIGDYNELNVEVRFENVNTGAKIDAPKHACFRVNKDTSKDIPKDAKLYGSFIKREDMNFMKRWATGSCGVVTDGVDHTHYEGMQGQEYVINKDDLDSTYDRTRYGFTYGVLVAPFKYYPKQGHFESRATVGGFIGWRVHDRQGASNVIAFALGPTTATVNNGAGDVSVTGASAALSWHADIKDSFTTGAMLGWDFFSKTANVPYAGKMWVGVTLGYKAE